MPQSSSLRFSRTVHTLASVARAGGLVVPGFRSPPRLEGVQRSIRRRDGASTVAVTVRGRPWPAVQADLIEGVIAANELSPVAADQVRARLWEALLPRPEGVSAVPGASEGRRREPRPPRPSSAAA